MCYTVFHTGNRRQAFAGQQRMSVFSEKHLYGKEQVIKMKKYVCEVCGYVYDPEVGDPDNGIEPGTSFEDLPEDWVCPLCSVGKDQFAEE